MDSTVVGAIIGAIAILLVGFGKGLVPVFHRKIRDISGDWSGKAVYSYDPDNKKHAFTANFKQYGNNIKGTIIADSGAKYKVSGCVKETEYITLALEHKSIGVVNYGLGILRYARNTKSLEGEVFARGRHHDLIFTVMFTMKSIK